MGYGAGGTGGGRDLGFENVPPCEPDPDFEAYRQEIIVEASAITLVVVVAVVLAGAACWLVLSGKWTVMLIKLEQKIQLLSR